MRHSAGLPVTVGGLWKAVITSLFAVAALAVFTVPARAEAALPSTLVGEDFYAHYMATYRVGEVEVTSNCRQGLSVGDTLTITYSARGLAYGPYPGTFTETGTVSGTVSSASEGILFAPISEWNATFTIDSVLAQVTGNKSLSTSQGIVCVPLAVQQRFGYGGVVNWASATATLRYEATIKTATGSFTDEGLAYGWTNDVEDPVLGRVFEHVAEFFFLSTGVVPVDTSGKATGGGQVLSGSNPRERVTFGFNARKTEDGRLEGKCNVVDHATKTHVKCRTVTDYQQIGKTATWEGTAEVNGVEEHYRITVQDNGESNSGLDTFSIKTETYEAAGNVEKGDVQLHKSSG